jgi:hypothetical protein
MRKLVTRSSIVAALVLGGFIIVSCGSDSSEDTPCEGKLKDVCGRDCDTDADCAAGTYCGPDGKCTADCLDASDCDDGEFCSANGKCLTGIQLDSGSGGGGGGDGCIAVDVTFEKQIPTVVLLIDQSGSMEEQFGGAGTRWNVVKNALMDPNTGIVNQLEAEVRFGLSLYTSHDGNSGGTCPILTSVLPPALNNYDAINAVYGPANSDGETPTGESIDAVAAVLAPFAEPGPKAIVLATDGEPDTCAVPNPQNGQPESIQAAQDAYAQDISTYIISVGADVSLGHLQDMANAGVGLPVGGSQNAPFYQALDQAALVKAFNDIIYGVRPCTFKLNGTVDTAQAGKGTVILDSNPLGYQDPDGWQLSAPDEVELLGAACQAIKTGDHSLSINFPCGAFTPPPTK